MTKQMKLLLITDQTYEGLESRVNRFTKGKGTAIVKIDTSFDGHMVNALISYWEETSK